MSEYRTVRGKMVHLGAVSLSVDHNGQLIIRVREQTMSMSEEDASAFYDLLGDVCEWSSNKGQTENQLDRSAEKEDADAEAGKI
jgi:hypothetical protein